MSNLDTRDLQTQQHDYVKALIEEIEHRLERIVCEEYPKGRRYRYECETVCLDLDEPIGKLSAAFAFELRFRFVEATGAYSFTSPSYESGGHGTEYVVCVPFKVRQEGRVVWFSRREA